MTSDKLPSRAGQVGGSHYSTMAVQPFELGMANLYDPAAFSIIKYLSRFESKGGYEDLKKSSHICEIRRDESKVYGVPPEPRDIITIHRYCRLNNFGPSVRAALSMVDTWCRSRDALDQDQWCYDVQTYINRVAAAHYPDQPSIFAK